MPKAFAIVVAILTIMLALACAKQVEQRQDTVESALLSPSSEASPMLSVTPRPTVPPVTTSTPTPPSQTQVSPLPVSSPSTRNLNFSCEQGANVKSYRYTMKFKMDVPGLTELQGLTDDYNDEYTDESLDAFGTLFLGLLSDIEVSGAFVAPDRHQSVFKVGGSEFIETRTIGDKSWTRLGFVWEEADSATDIDSLSPLDMCEGMPAELGALLNSATFSRETIQGINTRHYKFDKNDVQHLSEFVDETGDLESVDEFLMEMWLAEDNAWLIQLRMMASGRDAEGTQMKFDVSYETRDINSPDIQIEPPRL
jgi:hypothetical protein